MNLFKAKYLTEYQRISFKLKKELKKPNPNLWVRLKISHYRSQLEHIRIRQFTEKNNAQDKRIEDLLK